jgi:translation initiation factor 4G
LKYSTIKKIICRYDREFLLQFMLVCKERPATLPPLDSIGLEPVDHTHAMSRGGSGHHRPSSAVPPSRQATVGLGFTPSALEKSGANNIFSMGNLATMGASSSSEERYVNSNRAASVSGTFGMQYTSNRLSMMQGTASQGAGAPFQKRSKLGENRNENQMQNLDPVVPPQASENRWDRKAIKVDQDSPELVEHKVKGLLNKLTTEKYASISDQIIAWANNSEKEKDGRTLIQVIRLVFEKATDEATWSEIYARLCRKMMEQISTNVQDDGIKNHEGKPIRGGQLFRKYFLNLCQEEFERGWVAKEATAAAAATKALEDEAVKAANAKIEEGGTEIVLYSDEYYAAQKIKRQRRGLIKFLGELFKLQMLTERIMHECVQQLLLNPKEEEIESLCEVLTVVGSMLDIQKARGHLDVYFSRMENLMKSPNVAPRLQYMLQVGHWSYIASISITLS